MKLIELVITVLLVVTVGSGSENQRYKRSLGALGSLSTLFGATTPSPLAKYPVWKVHKYTGIDLRPVRPDEEHYSGDYEYGGIQEPRETAGEAPSLVEVPDVGANSHSLAALAGDMDNQNHGDPPQSQGGDNSDSQGALAALDNLAPIASLLPGENGQGGGLLSLFGLGRSTQKAQDKVGIVGSLVAPHVIKKKKKHIIGLAALANLLRLSNIGKPSFGGGPTNIQDVLGGLVETVTRPKSVYPIQSSIYREIPESYPSGPSLLSKIPIIGSHFSPSGTPINLPEPILPEIPALDLVPEAPKIPKLYLPGPYKVPYSTGSYVSIRVPTPPQIHKLVSPPEYTSPPDIPSTSYGIPVETPTKVYGPPTSYIHPLPRDPVYTQPAPEYKQPQTYSPPVQEYQQLLSYSPPAQSYQQPQSFSSPDQDYQQPQPFSSPAQDYQQPQSYSPLTQSYQEPQTYSLPTQDYQQPQSYSPPAHGYQQTQTYNSHTHDYQQPQPHSPPVPEYQQPQPYSSPVPDYQQPQPYSPPVPDYQQPQPYSPPVPDYQQPQPYSPPVPDYQQPQPYSPPVPEYQQPQPYSPSTSDHQQPQQYSPPTADYKQQQSQPFSPPTLEYNQPTYQQTQNIYPSAQKKNFKEETSEFESNLSSGWQEKNELTGTAENEVTKQK